MNPTKSILSIIIFIFLPIISTAQLVDLHSSIYFPAIPNGGVKELQEFVKQEIVYPEKAKNNQINGIVYINFIVNANGIVNYKEIISSGNKSIDNEAERIFDKIVWEKDASKTEKSLRVEKFKLEFSAKKYARLIKKRGYDSLPYGNYQVDYSSNYYTINQVDNKPIVIGNSSINEFVSKNFKYPTIAYQRSISGRVTVEFIIEPYGMVSNIKIIEPVAGGCNEETVRLMKKIQWTPSFKDGKAVRTIFQYQLNFVHPGGTVK